MAAVGDWLAAYGPLPVIARRHDHHPRWLEVPYVNARGGIKVIISPNAIVEVTKAIRATGIQAFPAEALPPYVIKAWKAVLPKHIPVLGAGGITFDNMAEYTAAGTPGFGIRSSLYRPGMDATAVAKAACKLPKLQQQIRTSGLEIPYVDGPRPRHTYQVTVRLRLRSGLLVCEV